MLAARAHRGDQLLRLEQMDAPEIAAGEVLIRNQVSGVNRGTLSLWRHSPMMSQLPTVLSYEVAGEVAAVGAEVEGLKAGDRVMAHTLLSCGQCEYCRSGEDADCPAAANMGHIHYGAEGLALYRRYHNGGLAQYVRVPASSLERLPDQVSYEVAARLVSYGVSYRALSRLMLKPGATLTINGITGAFGAAAAQLACLFGVARVVGVARSEDSLSRIRGLVPPSVDFVTLESLDAGWETGDGLRQRLLKDIGQIDAALDFTPAGIAASQQTLGALRKGGVMVVVGGNHERFELPYLFLMQNSLTLRGSRGSGRSITRTLLKLAAAGQVDFTRLVSHRFDLASVNDGVRLIDDRAEKPMFISVNTA
jgi:D-arabinose 1-dehydrogenase-like Zn-dependent alcohol dehydrogenase